jgi:hypothetical protein
MHITAPSPILPLFKLKAWFSTPRWAGFHHLPNIATLVKILSYLSPLLCLLSVGQMAGPDMLESLELGLWPRILVKFAKMATTIPSPPALHSVTKGSLNNFLSLTDI